ncbi:hypothetical protein [Bacillus cereus]|uniref:hypothetical protein n=1 Tax=Bacillus cereus TaxID=1396 RepID=UPI00211116D5|nr:hypothetical protein [Bacillus cereus]HEQ3527504.1 hypothetical protein [Bacillus cereus]
MENFKDLYEQIITVSGKDFELCSELLDLFDNLIKDNECVEKHNCRFEHSSPIGRQSNV